MALDSFLRKKSEVRIKLDYGGFLETTNSLFEGLTDLEKGKLITDFYGQLSDKGKNQLIHCSVKQNAGRSFQTILVDEEGNSTLYWKDWKDIDVSKFKKLENRRIEIREEESYIIVDFILDEQTGFEEPMVVEKYIAPEDKGITPMIIWERDKTTGERKYFCGRIKQELIDAFPDLFSQNHDTLLGQLVVADYSENVREDLPKHFPLKKDGTEQDMLEAQMVVFVPMFAQEFLKESPPILGLEALPRSPAM